MNVSSMQAVLVSVKLFHHIGGKSKKKKTGQLFSSSALSRNRNFAVKDNQHLPPCCYSLTFWGGPNIITISHFLHNKPFYQNSPLCVKIVFPWASHPLFNLPAVCKQPPNPMSCMNHCCFGVMQPLTKQRQITDFDLLESSHRHYCI